MGAAGGPEARPGEGGTGPTPGDWRESVLCGAGGNGAASAGVAALEAMTGAGPGLAGLDTRAGEGWGTATEAGAGGVATGAGAGGGVGTTAGGGATGAGGGVTGSGGSGAASFGVTTLGAGGGSVIASATCGGRIGRGGCKGAGGGGRFRGVGFGGSGSALGSSRAVITSTGSTGGDSTRAAWSHSPATTTAATRPACRRQDTPIVSVRRARFAITSGRGPSAGAARTGRARAGRPPRRGAHRRRRGHPTTRRGTGARRTSSPGSPSAIGRKPSVRRPLGSPIGISARASGISADHGCRPRSPGKPGLRGDALHGSDAAPSGQGGPPRPRRRAPRSRG